MATDSSAALLTLASAGRLAALALRRDVAKGLKQLSRTQRPDLKISGLSLFEFFLGPIWSKLFEHILFVPFKLEHHIGKKCTYVYYYERQSGRLTRCFVRPKGE